jgi:pSer/pThr/pTyr-binding forkhead associated (FHA) protein
MEQIIIQYGIKQGHIAELVRSHGKDILIGRSFNNELVIHDDYIAPEQLRIYQEEDLTWWMEILDHTNSVILNSKVLDNKALAIDAEENSSKVQLHSGDNITIGRTTLSVYSADHPVEKARKLLSRRLHQNSISLTLPMLLLLLLSAFDIGLDHYLISPQDSLASFSTTTLLSAFTVLIWVSLWALAGRIFRHNSHFAQQLLATTLIFSALTIAIQWPSLLEFNFSSAITGTVLNYLIAFTIVTLLLKFHLLFATNIRKTGLVALSISALIVGGSASYQIYQETEFSAQPTYSKVIQPNFMHLGSDITMDEYLDKMQNALNDIDENNQQE